MNHLEALIYGNLIGIVIFLLVGSLPERIEKWYRKTFWMYYIVKFDEDTICVKQVPVWYHQMEQTWTTRLGGKENILKWMRKLMEKMFALIGASEDMDAVMPLMFENNPITVEAVKYDQLSEDEVELIMIATYWQYHIL